MKTPINVNVVNGKIFFIENINDIIFIQYNMRLSGDILKFKSSIYGDKIILTLSMEEVFLGIEFDFLKLKLFEVSDIIFQKYIYVNLVKKSYFVQNPINKLFSKTKKKNTCNTMGIWKLKKNAFILIIKNSLLRHQCTYNRLSIKACDHKKIIENKTDTNIKKNLKRYFSKINLFNTTSYIIFKDLWMRGFRISSGIKFGSNYLVYSNLIEAVHSTISLYIIKIFLNFKPDDLISFGRIGTTTKKMTIIGFITEENNVCYISFKWNPFFP
jgi:tRNA-intron lyase